jgi:hypothetical protein
MTFGELLTAANQSNAKAGRNPDQWTPTAVETWRSVEPELARMLDAAFALGLRLDEKVTAADEDLVRGMRAEMDAATAAMKVAKI